MPGSFDLLHGFALWIAFPIAFIPAALNWWWSRTLRSGDAATLPERHLAMVQRVSATTIACSIVIGVTAGWLTIAILPLEVLALTWTTHRVRRSLLGETWPFSEYFLWRVRLVAGIWAFWWFLALVPAAIASLERPTVWWSAGLATIVGLVWHHWYSRILLVVFEASPLSRSDLDGLFEAIFGRARNPVGARQPRALLPHLARTTFLRRDRWSAGARGRPSRALHAANPPSLHNRRDDDRGADGQRSRPGSLRARL